jgi:tRNA/rRNA methyltransferase
VPTTDGHACAVVLVRTKYPGNLGSVARAMANFGVRDLRLVTPEADPLSLEARALASHGESLLAQAQRYSTLAEAIADAVWVAGTSARTGGLYRRQNVLPAREGMARARAQQGRVAIVFGPEDHGLTNEEVSQCHFQLQIPASPEYPVLNLAQAVVITLYEWFQWGMAVAEGRENEAGSREHAPGRSGKVAREEGGSPESALATTGDLATMYDHLESALRAVHFIWGEKGDSVAHALRHLLYRAQPTELENKLLHGLARQLHWYVERHPPQKAKQPPE